MLTQFVVDAGNSVEGYYTNHAGPKIVGGFVAAVPITWR